MEEAKARGLCTVDVFDILSEHRDEYIYYKTDHHFTSLGAYYCYAAFLNSNQSTTVVSGGGEGKLLILRDSYANCFAQFVIDDYAETHLIDLRFFRGSVSDYVAQNGITQVLVLYNIPNFASDTSIR